MGLTPATLPVTGITLTAQLSNSDNSNCWQTTFVIATAKNSDKQFKAKGP